MSPHILRDISLFANLSEVNLEEIAKFGKQFSCKKGCVVLSTQRAEETFLYVITGWIKLFSESIDGEEIVMDILTKRQYCGEHYLFRKRCDMHYMAESISDVDVFTIPIQLLERILRSSHQLSLNLLQNTLEKQERLNMEVEHLSIQNAAQRIGCFILRVCVVNKGHPTTFFLPYGKSILAARLGMRPETFSRAFIKLSRECDITFKDGFLQVDDIERITRYVCQHCSKVYPSCQYF